MTLSSALVRLLAEAPTGDLHPAGALERWAVALAPEIVRQLWQHAELVAGEQGGRALRLLRQEAITHGRAATAARWLAAAAARGAA